jgi:hypothetical protein
MVRFFPDISGSLLAYIQANIFNVRWFSNIRIWLNSFVVNLPLSLSLVGQRLMLSFLPLLGE